MGSSNFVFTYSCLYLCILCRKYSSSLNHRTQQKRKYAHLGRDQNHILLAEHKLTTPSLPSPSLPSSSNIKPSSFYSSSTGHTHPPATPTPNTEQTFVTNNQQHALLNNNDIVGKKNRRPFRTDDVSNKLINDGSQNAVSTNRRFSNHIQESHPPQTAMEYELQQPIKRHQDQFSNHVDHHWAESEGMSTDVPPNFQPIKIVSNYIHDTCTCTCINFETGKFRHLYCMYMYMY